MILKDFLIDKLQRFLWGLHIDEVSFAIYVNLYIQAYDFLGPCWFYTA